jgi:hypothetical protein
VPRPIRAAALAATLALSGCAASTSLVQVWRDPDYAARPVKRVFCVAMMPNQQFQGQFEDAMAQALIAKGFQAATTTGVVPPGQYDPVAIQEYVRKNDVDLVIQQRLRKETKTEVVPASVTYGGGWYGGGVAYTSGSITSETTVMAETGVFDARVEPNALVWSGSSSTFQAQGAADAARSLASALVADMMKAGILVK